MPILLHQDVEWNILKQMENYEAYVGINLSICSFSYLLGKDANGSFDSLGFSSSSSSGSGSFSFF